MDLKDVVKQFETEGITTEINSFGSGLINSTYQVITKGQNTPDYILQSINSDIFKNVPELTTNIARITNHIKEKLNSKYTPKELQRHSLTVISTNNNQGFYKDGESKYWRMFTLIEGSKVFEVLKNPVQAELCGLAFGEFQSMLSDLPAPPLFEVLPGFHNTALRIDKFKDRVKENPFERLEEVQEEVDFLLLFEEEMRSITKMGSEGILPLRTVHQDAKLSNILFDENDEVLCVIDFDTVMPGYLCYDFGDTVRGGMNTGKEDDENLDNVTLDMDLFKGFARGYYQASSSFITSAEIKTLAFGAKLLTYEQAVRFLDDYLNGDQYYQTFKEKHNLIRTRAQIKFFKELITNFEEMDSYVLSLYNSSLS